MARNGFHASLPPFALCLILGLGAGLLPAFAGSEDGFICFPGAPDAGEAGDRVAAALGAELFAHSKASRSARYFNARESGGAWAEKQDAGWALIGFEVYLEWRRQKRSMAVLATAEVDGAVEKPFLLVVSKDSERSGLADFAGVELRTNLARDERFFRRLVFAGKGAGIKLQWIDRPLRELKRCARGQIPGLIIDEEQWAGIQKLKRYGSKLKVIYRSAPLPKALVVAFKSCTTEDRKAAAARLLCLDRDPAGRKLLETLRASAFRAAPKAEALEAWFKAYAGDKP